MTHTATATVTREIKITAEVAREGVWALCVDNVIHGYIVEEMEDGEPTYQMVQGGGRYRTLQALVDSFAQNVVAKNPALW